jgi:type IV pilus assembly protein PilC
MNLQNIFFRLSTKEKMLFARHMQLMIHSGMQILQGLEMLKKQTRSRAFIKVLDQLIQDVKNGHYLSAGLDRYKNVFGEFFINLVRVGETSGTLAENFEYLSEELHKKDELKKKIRGAMVYPIIILGATMGITSILAFFIFPKILPVLKNINVPLPTMTIWFINISDFMLAYGVYVIVGFFAFIIGFWLLLKVPTARLIWHQVALRIPVIRNMVINVNVISFARTMGLLLKAGIKIVEALEITSRTLPNLVYKNYVMEISESVKRGDPMSKYLMARPDLFPLILAQMVVVGENTGKLEESLLFLANFYEGEMDESTKAMSNFLEPVMLLIMGVIVGFVALSIITPIYKITQTLGR